jgi:hypothetical protein
MNADRNVNLTQNPKTFINALRSGDVLLFDSLHPISHMIKLADNSPVNHCAIYGKDGAQIIHASLPEDGWRGKTIVQEPLEQRLESGLTRSLTALRHPDPSLGARVLNKAHEWMDDAENRYGYTDLLGLSAQCFNRSYGSTAAALESMSRVLRSLSRVAESGRDPRLSLTCSEFVYSVYIETDDKSIEIRDSLSRWRERPSLLDRITGTEGSSEPKYVDPTFAGSRSSERRPAGGWSVPDDPFNFGPGKGSHTGLGFNAPDPFDPFESSDPEPEVELLFVDRDGSEQPAPEEYIEGTGLLVWLKNERYFLERQRQRNRDRKKRLIKSAQDPRPWAEHVTPFDLWQSESLEAFQVLHLPPGPGDKVRQRTGGRS